MLVTHDGIVTLEELCIIQQWDIVGHRIGVSCCVFIKIGWKRL